MEVNLFRFKILVEMNWNLLKLIFIKFKRRKEGGMGGEEVRKGGKDKDIL